MTKKKFDAGELFKQILTRTVAQIIVNAIDAAWVEKFDDPTDYWNNRTEIIHQMLGERIERGEQID